MSRSERLIDARARGANGPGDGGTSGAPFHETGHTERRPQTVLIDRFRYDCVRVSVDRVQVVWWLIARQMTPGSAISHHAPCQKAFAV